MDLFEDVSHERWLCLVEWHAAYEILNFRDDVPRDVVAESEALEGVRDGNDLTSSSITRIAP